MSNFSQDQENQGIARPACRRREQVTPQIDADIAEKGHLWMETSSCRDLINIPEPETLKKPSYNGLAGNGLNKFDGFRSDTSWM